jgi:ribonuclease HI
MKGLLPAEQKKTSQNAEIFAAQTALENGQGALGLDTTQLVVITDSDYLTKCMSKYIYKWLRNGFLDAEGKKVVNWKALQALHEQVECMESEEVKVCFWRVPREQNENADRLANEAFGDSTS